MTQVEHLLPTMEQLKVPPAPGVALVTGRTSGIGLATVTLLASQGYRVFLCARNQDKVESTVAELVGNGFDVAGTAGDVGSTEDVKRILRCAVDRYGSIDVLVNNAGNSGGGVTADIVDELWLDVINTNLNAVFFVTREVLTTGGMRSKKRVGSSISRRRPGSSGWCWVRRIRLPSMA